MQDRDKEKIRELLAAVLERLETIPETEETAAQQTYARLSSEARTPGSTASCDQPAPSSHPGLQRFVLQEAPSDPQVPKPCFMEPDRKCVHSGACEMRGF